MIMMTTRYVPFFLLIASATSMMFSCAPSSGTDGATVPAPTVVNLDKIPVAKPDPNGRKNLVISPYRPYNLIDITGFKKGGFAGDPSTATIDSKTGKPIPGTAKMFRLP